MSPDDLDRRLVAVGDRLAGLGKALRDGGPWPLAARFDHSPEADWGPREILAHLGEMLPFWLGEAERIVEAADESVTFGRVATDELRLAIIERDRTLPMRELDARVQAGIERWRRRWAELDTVSRERSGRHLMLGELTVTDIVNRSVVGHLEDHLDQLTAALGGHPTSG